jgi:hypothetical protein
MAYKLIAGAPFDQGNLFFNPATDAGLFVNPFPHAISAQVEGGFFADGSTDIIVDGGTFPLEGTATYDPNKTYGPDDIIIIPGFNDEEPTYE